MPNPVPPDMRHQPGHFPNWPSAPTLNHLTLQWLAPQGTIIDRSGWQNHGRTQYVLLETSPPEHQRTLVVITIHHSRASLHWKTQTEYENPNDITCPARLMRLAGPLPNDQWKATLWRARNRKNLERAAATRRILDHLRNNRAPHDPRLVLNSGEIVQYTRGIYRGRPTDGYWDPRTSTVIKLDHAHMDPVATLALRED